MPMIGKYRLESELSAQNAGFSRWGRCQRDGHTYFIKEFLAPVWPMETAGLPASLVARKRRLCDEFYAQKRALYHELWECRTGNIVMPQDLFRYESKYYMVTDWVEPSGMGVREVAAMSDDKRQTLMRALVFSVATLHAHGIVHADLKCDNLLFRRTPQDYVTAKLIDFDGGFLVGHMPEEVQGDFVYLAPETYLRMEGTQLELTPKVDVFALALILHQCWTGRLPNMRAGYRYGFESVLSGDALMLDSQLPPVLRELLPAMLAKDPDERPNAAQVFSRFARAFG